MFREGQQIGAYTLIGKLGKGGFGEVWLAEKRSQFVTKRVAVKLPLDEQVNFEAIRQEATLWEQASGHPNVLPIIDADVYDGQVVIVSEYADGGSLYDRLKREQKLSMKEAVEMTIGILSGLDFLHSRRIIHRDIKPQNILLQGNTPRLADFGISRAMNTTVVSSAVIGTDAYMSPEAFDGKRNVQTDIWSVGVVLYLLLKGSLPFPQEHPSERMFAVLTKDFEPLGDEVPTDLRRIVEKALQKLPENRFQTCAEMRDLLFRAHVALAHPTLAKTEVYLKTDLPLDNPPAPTIIAANNQTEATEIRTVPSSAPSSNAPPANQQYSTQPAPTLEAAYQQNSVATQVDQTPPISQPLAPVSRSSDYVAKKRRNLMLAVGGIGAILLIFAALSVGLAYKYFFAPNYPPHLRSRIERWQKKYPYFVYTDLQPFQEKDKYGFKDSNDKIVIPAKYDGAYDFSEGLAPVLSDGKWGYIDEKDNLVVPFKYDAAFLFNENLAAVKLNGKTGFIDMKGREVIALKFDDGSYWGFNEGLAGVKLNGKFGFIDYKGNEVIPFKYDEIMPFSESLVAVKEGDKWGFIDKKGGTVISFKYEEASVFNEDVVRVKLNGRYGYVNKSDKTVIPFKYEDGGSMFEDGYAIVCSGKAFADTCGMIDKTDKVIVPLKYDWLWSFNEGLAAVKQDDKWGFVDKKGVEVIPLKYDVVRRDFDGITIEAERNGRRWRVYLNGGETDLGAGTFVPVNTNFNATNKAANTAANISNTNAANTLANDSNANVINKSANGSLSKPAANLSNIKAGNTATNNSLPDSKY